MESEEIGRELVDTRQRLEREEGLELLDSRNQPFDGFAFEDMEPTEFIRPGPEAGVQEVYILENAPKMVKLTLLVSAFSSENGRTQYLRAAEPGEQSTEIRDRTSVRYGFGCQGSDEEKERKEEIANELLTDHREYLKDDEMFERHGLV